MSPAARFLVGWIWIYRATLGPLLALLGGAGSGCRLAPTCSEYARQAVMAHGARRGGWLAVQRLCRCHPWGRSGWDPPPVVGVEKSRR